MFTCCYLFFFAMRDKNGQHGRAADDKRLLANIDGTGLRFPRQIVVVATTRGSIRIGKQNTWHKLRFGIRR